MNTKETITAYFITESITGHIVAVIEATSTMQAYERFVAMRQKLSRDLRASAIGGMVGIEPVGEDSTVAPYPQFSSEFFDILEGSTATLH